jgi:hypothetical protein
MLQPTAYQDVNRFLSLLLANLQTLLQEQLVGLYLGGSLALGDFDPQRSDIDFIAVTVDDVPPEMIVALEAMHARLWATEAPWARKLDGSYVPQQVFRRWSDEHAPCPFVEGDNVTVTRQGSAVIQRHIIHQYGISVAGPSPQLLLDAVDADELRDDPDWVQASQQQTFAILSLCRALYTLEHGGVASKPVAARWCQQAIGEEWAGLIEWALARPHDAGSDHLAATLKLLRYTLDRYQQL